MYIYTILFNDDCNDDECEIIDSYEDFKDAKKAAIIEENNRAGKYDAVINNYTLNELPEEL